MFFKKSAADEIALSMEQGLIDDGLTKEAERENRLLKAADLLNAAAEIFDEVGFTRQAEAITDLLEIFAGKKKKVKSKVKKKNPFVENEKETGTMFSKKEFDKNCAYCGSDLNKAETGMKPKNDREEILADLDHFAGKNDGMDFEDELDFSGFDDRMHGRVDEEPEADDDLTVW